MSSSTADALARRWAEIVRVALVGTARQSLAAGGPLADLARDGDPEGTLLAEAAALTLHRRAGALPATIDAPPPPRAPDETLPRCRPGAARLLDGFLAGDNPEIIPEWLALAARAGVRTDEVALPGLLELGRVRPDLRPAILAVLGARGRWLAATQPSWSWAIAAPSEETWATGSRAERLALLAELRPRDPERARQLVESTFHAETPEDRAAFVTALAAGLSDADEPFLEERLDDRRKEVRVAAAELLVRLPRSRLATRMAARARAAVDTTPPRAADDAMLRDGLEASAPRGEAATTFYLRRLVSSAPLATWGEPAAAIARARTGDDLETLLGAWAIAAARQRDGAWAEAILGVTLDLPDLVALLPPERREAVAERALRAGRGPDSPAWTLLPHLTHPWSESFSRRIVATLRELAAVRAQAARALLAVAAPRLAPPVVAALVAELAMRESGPWPQVLVTAHAVLERRAALHKELAP